MNSSKSRLPSILVVLALLALAAFLGWRYVQSELAPVAATGANSD